MKKLFTISALVFVAVAGIAQKAKTITITGKVSGDTKGQDYIMYFTSSEPLDSVQIKNGKFVIKVPFTETYTQALVTQYDMRVKKGYRPFPLLIDGSSDIHIEMDIAKGIFEANISGSPSAAAFSSFLKQQNATFKRISDALVVLYGKGFLPQNDPLAGKMSVSRDSLSKLYMGAVVSEFVEANKKNYVGVYVLNSAGKSYMNLDLLEKTLQSLPVKMQQTAEGKELAAYIRGVRNTTIGATIKNFVLNDPEGKPVSFDKFKGKYVWIDFWASWCGPCKQAFPHMKELYAKYKDKGFEILGISADSKIGPWLKILPVLKNPWPQVWDNKNIMSEFAVTAFPTSYLIDPDGKIVLIEVGYEPNGESAMDKKLAELFGSVQVAAAISVQKDTTRKKVMSSVPMMKINQQ